MKKVLTIGAALAIMSSTALAEPVQPMRPVELSDTAMDRVTAGQGALGLLAAVVSALQVIAQLPPGAIPAKGKLIQFDGRTILLCGSTACAAAAGKRPVLIISSGVAIAAAGGAAAAVAK